MFKLFKSGLKIITIFIPKSLLVKVAAEIAIWAVESLVKNSKSTLDDKGLEIVKKVVNKEKKKPIKKSCKSTL